MSDQVEITDVTLRDGLQMEAKILSSPEKLGLLQKLFLCGYHRLEVTSFSHPKWMPQFADSDAFSAGLNQAAGTNFSLMGFVPNERGLSRLLLSPIGWASAFVATSETFNHKNVNATISETLQNLKNIVAQTHQANRKIRIYISTVFGCPYEGKISESQLNKVLSDVVALRPDEIALSDTIGVATPNDVKKIVSHFVKTYAKEKTALHLHNTYGLAIANAMAGYEAGIRKFDGSTGGVGGCPYAKGAAGNVASEELGYAFYRQGYYSSYQPQAIQAAMAELQSLGVSVQSHLGEIISKGGTWYGVK